jgi:hypothetical protein
LAHKHKNNEYLFDPAMRQKKDMVQPLKDSKQNSCPEVAVDKNLKTLSEPD